MFLNNRDLYAVNNSFCMSEWAWDQSSVWISDGLTDYTGLSFQGTKYRYWRFMHIDKCTCNHEDSQIYVFNSVVIIVS